MNETTEAVAPPVTLAEFLRARLDEDEAVARAATPGPWGSEFGGVITTPGYVDVARTADLDMIGIEGYTYGPTDQERADGYHIARHDPARVLAEVEAKRRIVELHSAEPWEDDDIRCIACSTAWTGDWAPGPYEDRTAAAWPCATLRLLALPYAGHSAYRSEWAP